MARQDWVIDVDAHVTEPGDVWTARLPAKLRDRGPRLERDRTGRDVWHVADSTPLVPVGFTAVAGWPEPFPSGPKNMDEVPPAAWDAHARLDYLDSIGVWAQVMYPNVAGFGNQQFLALEDPELDAGLCPRVQRLPHRVVRRRRAAPPCGVGDAVLGRRRAVAEVRRCAELGHRGVLFTGEPQR